ncbi:MAG: MbcA/ParS/Xre antitoxin family protein [Bryobacteraceae bacterium]|nr:MbcA/ParS/Xre antitoxin family protein [Bryobacteraceae bacterium]
MTKEDVLRHAIDTFGPNKYKLWLVTAIPSLGDQAPESLLATQEGRKQVDDVLTRIDYEVF